VLPDSDDISKVTSPQQFNGPLPKDFDGLGVDKDTRAPLTPIGVSRASSSAGHGQGSDATGSVDAQPGAASSLGNGVAEEDVSRSRLTNVHLRPTQINQTLRRIFFETYLEHAYIWSPILDQDLMRAHPEFADSMLLNHSLALVGTNLKPPLLQYTSSAQHYQMARHSFYNCNETNPLVAISSIMLFHYWDLSNVDSANGVDTDWWWLGNAIRLAQAEGLQREGRPGPFQSLKKRIWWALYARERMTAICLGRPCVIDPAYCNVPMPTLNDFPSDCRFKASIFIQYVKLSDVLGDISKLLAQGAAYFPATISARKRLVEWVRNIPSDMQLSTTGGVMKDFNREVLLLHIPYLGALTMVYLSFSSDSPPKACVPGIVAAAVLARICEEFLARGSIRFIPEETARFISFAILTLAHARQVECLTAHADTDIWILLATLRQMAPMWSSARVFAKIYEKIQPDLGLSTRPPLAPPPTSQHQCEQARGDGTDEPHECTLPHCLEELASLDGVNWMEYFPYGNCNTTPMLGAIIAAQGDILNLSGLDLPHVVNNQSMHEIFANFDEFGNLFHAEKGDTDAALH